MTRFSKKSSTLSLNSNLSVFSIPKPYNALDHFEICINITKNINLPIPESHKSFYESYKKYISFKKYSHADKRFEKEFSKRPLLLSCLDVTKYMNELALPEKISKLKYDYNWSMERWKIMYKKRVAIERFKNSVDKVIQSLKKNLDSNKTVVSIKCDPWIHYMPDPYQDSTVYTTKYCLKKIKGKYFSYFVCEDEFLSEPEYSFFYLNGFNETLNDNYEENIQLPSSFNNNYNYKDTLKEKKKKKRLNIKNSSSTKYNISHSYVHNNEFIYFVKKIIMERKRTNPSGDPWDAFFYIHMEPDKKNLTFKMNKNEMKIEKNSPVPGVKCLNEGKNDDDNELISFLYSTPVSPQSFDYENNDNSNLNNIIEVEENKSTEIIEINEEDFEKLNINDDIWSKNDKNNDRKTNETILISPKYTKESMGLSRCIMPIDKSSLQLPKIDRVISCKDEKVSEREEIFVKPVSKNILVETCERGTNTLPSLQKKLQIKSSKSKYCYDEKKRKLPIISKKQSPRLLNWKVTTIVRYSPDGKTSSNRSFYLPRIVRSTFQPQPKTTINIQIPTNSSTLPALPVTNRPPSSLKNNLILTSRPNLLPTLF